MRAVNLLPREESLKRRKQTSWPVVIGLAGGAVVATALGAALLQANGSLADSQDRLGFASAQLAAMPEPAKEQVDNSAELDQARTERAAALASAFAYHVPWDRVLRRFALVLPDDVWLTSLSATAPRKPSDAAASTTVATTGAPTGFTVQGFTYSLDSVARLLSRLSVLPDLTNVQLQTSTWTKVGERPVVSFTILADVRSGGGA
jgi:Tfp pilus assembly protein PilN